MSTVWLWLLLVAAARPRRLAARPVGRRRCRFERRPVGSVRLGHPTETPCWSRPTPRGAGCAALRARRLAAHGRRHAATGTGSGSPPATGRCCAPPLLPRPPRRPARRRASPSARAGRSGWPRGSARSTCPGSVRSLPPFESRKHLPSRLARLRELDGRAAVRVRGQGTEFDSLREYVRGDDVRSIDWRASARNRNVVVRTWQPERDRRVVLVLDTSRTSAGRRRGRAAARLGDGRRPAAGRARRPGRRPDRLRRRRPAGPGPAAVRRRPRHRRRGSRTRWPTSSR